MIRERGGAGNDEDDLSAKNQAESESSRLQSQDEQRGRQKGISCQKSKRKSKINSLMKSLETPGRKKLWPFVAIKENFPGNEG